MATYGKDVRDTDILFIMFNCYKHSAAQDVSMLTERSGLPVIVLLQLHLDFKPQVAVNFILSISIVSLKGMGGPQLGWQGGKKKGRELV